MVICMTRLAVVGSRPFNAVFNANQLKPGSVWKNPVAPSVVKKLVRPNPSNEGSS